MGAALGVHFQYLDKPRTAEHTNRDMRGSYLGPAFSNNDIEKTLRCS